MPALLLSTKFDIPLLCPDLVRRENLLDRLNNGLWQAEGFLRRLTQVVELRQADLQFSTQEIVEYFHVIMKTVPNQLVQGGVNQPAVTSTPESRL